MLAPFRIFWSTVKKSELDQNAKGALKEEEHGIVVGSILPIFRKKVNLPIPQKSYNRIPFEVESTVGAGDSAVDCFGFGI
jgi:hypothetical protein